MVRLYLEIERTRFADRLTVEIEIPTKFHPAPIPSLGLQPLVENAIHHGLSRSEKAGTPTIGELEEWPVRTCSSNRNSEGCETLEPFR